MTSSKLKWRRSGKDGEINWSTCLPLSDLLLVLEMYGVSLTCAKRMEEVSKSSD